MRRNQFVRGGYVCGGIVACYGLRHQTVAPTIAPTPAPTIAAVADPTAVPETSEPAAAPQLLPEVNPLEVTGDIVTAGSSTVFPLAERMAERFPG